MPVETRTIQQAYTYALDATPRQTRAFLSHAGGARFAFNWAADQCAHAIDAYHQAKAAGVDPDKFPGHFDLCKRWTAHKDDPDNGLHWVGENFVGTYQAAIRDAATAWKNFFDSRNGRRRGKPIGRPRFKSRHRTPPRFQVHGRTMRVVDAHHLKLPKIGVVKVHESTRKLLRRITKGTARLVRGSVSRQSNGRWRIALTVEIQREIRTGPSARQRAGGIVGVDLGVRDTITLSDGRAFTNPRHLDKAQAALARLNKAVARRVKGSRRRAKAVAALGRAHHRVANLRRDHTDKLTSTLIHTHAGIAVEGWDAQRLAHTGSKDLPRRVRRNRNRALADAAPGMVRWQLEHKAPWYGSTVVVTGRDETTGRTCSACGTARDKPVPPADELFVCPACGWSGDRRVNTARVVAKAARGIVDAPSGGESENARGGGVSPGAPRRGGRSSSKREAGSRGSPRGQTGAPGP